MGHSSRQLWFRVLGTHKNLQNKTIIYIYDISGG
jgi:hypothetical protein